MHTYPTMQLAFCITLNRSPSGSEGFCVSFCACSYSLLCAHTRGPWNLERVRWSQTSFLSAGKRISYDVHFAPSLREREEKSPGEREHLSGGYSIS